MATFPLSSAIQSPCVSCQSKESSKLVVATYLNYGKRLSYILNLVSRHIANSASKVQYQSRGFKLLAVSSLSVVETTKKVSYYSFRTEDDGHVKVMVEKNASKYEVSVEVSSLQLDAGESALSMSWGIFRSDSSSHMPLDFRNPHLNAKSSTIVTPFVKRSSKSFVIELEFDATLAPFYFSFLLKTRDSKDFEIRSHRKTSFCFPVGINRGSPYPQGLSYLADGSINFSLFSRNAKRVILCLFDGTAYDKPVLEIDLDPYVNRSGDIWHVSMSNDMNFTSYGYRCELGKGDKILLDPYAKIIGANLLGQLSKEPAFDWSGDVSPCLPMEKLVVYRLNVTRFTKDKSSNLHSGMVGTFLGITEKLQHFKDLGVNAILLEPIVPFGDQEGPYFPLHFFSPMQSYVSVGRPSSAIKSMKEMVKKLHESGIEVFLEVVFTHTAEDAALVEIDKYAYYHAEEGKDSSTRNAMNCNHPVVQQLILDSLRHWVIEFHIDGFSFINASSMLQGSDGEKLSRPPLIEAIAFDPIISKTKLIADCFDPYEKIVKETVFPHWKRWAEMNSRFCADIRTYLRGEGLLSNLATRLCGSGDVFSYGRGPAFSFNFISRNFGLSLVDLVSFSSSELTSELSWNCGEEGATNKTAVLERRLKQIRNFLFILFVSLGIPVLNMGDECGQSSGGSPEYNDLKPFNWSALGTEFGIQTTQFISFLAKLRSRRSDVFQKRDFLKVESIDWHGSDLSPPSWEDPTSKFLAMRLKADEEESESSGLRGDLFIAFNSADHPEQITLPTPPEEMSWYRLIDTALPYPGFFTMVGDPVAEQTPGLLVQEMKPHSCLLFEAKSPTSLLKV